MNEFEHTLMSIIKEHSTSLSDLSKKAGYDLLFFKSVVSGTSRQVPVDFFVRIANTLDLSDEEKDALVRSWAFGVERWS
jgi:predicted transcriptional regulator